MTIVHAFRIYLEPTLEVRHYGVLDNVLECLPSRLTTLAVEYDVHYEVFTPEIWDVDVGRWGEVDNELVGQRFSSLRRVEFRTCMVEAPEDVATCTDFVHNLFPRCTAKGILHCTFEKMYCDDEDTIMPSI